MNNFNNFNDLMGRHPQGHMSPNQQAYHNQMNARFPTNVPNQFNQGMGMGMGMQQQAGNQLPQILKNLELNQQRMGQGLKSHEEAITQIQQELNNLRNYVKSATGSVPSGNPRPYSSNTQPTEGVSNTGIRNFGDPVQTEVVNEPSSTIVQEENTMAINDFNEITLTKFKYKGIEIVRDPNDVRTKFRNHGDRLSITDTLSKDKLENLYARLGSKEIAMVTNIVLKLSNVPIKIDMYEGDWCSSLDEFPIALDEISKTTYGTPEFESLRKLNDYCTSVLNAYIAYNDINISVDSYLDDFLEFTDVLEGILSPLDFKAFLDGWEPFFSINFLEDFLEFGVKEATATNWKSVNEEENESDIIVPVAFMSTLVIDLCDYELGLDNKTIRFDSFVKINIREGDEIKFLVELMDGFKDKTNLFYITTKNGKYFQCVVNRNHDAILIKRIPGTLV